MFEKLFHDHDCIIFFDLETSGLSCKNDEIIEFAALKLWENANTEVRDVYVKLPNGRVLPEEVVHLTGITDQVLKTKGLSAREFSSLLADFFGNTKKPLLVAHNAHFDVSFLMEYNKAHKTGLKLFAFDYLDSLTVFRDRSPYPHKLKDAIAFYGLEDKVQNSHCAIDDVYALYEVVKKMEEEEHGFGLADYINLFGFNPKYGRPTVLPNIHYCKQPYSDFNLGIKLPEKMRERRKYA